MFRALLGVAACLMLGGCWGSEEPLFGQGDWATLDVAGEYRFSGIDKQADAPETVRVAQRPDRLIEFTPRGARAAEVLRVGLVSIPNGSGEFFLAVDRSEVEPREGELYAIARATDDALEFYMPDCAGTPPIEGLVRAEGLAGAVCEFETREALFEAGLLAESFLSESHIVSVAPFAKFEKVQPAETVETLESVDD